MVSFTSHGAMVDVALPGGGALHCYIPLTAMGTPPPTKARQVLKKGEVRPFVLAGLDPPRRVAELALAAGHVDRPGSGPRPRRPLRRPSGRPSTKVAPSTKKAAAKKAAAKKAGAKKAGKKAVAGEEGDQEGDGHGQEGAEEGRGQEGGQEGGQGQAEPAQEVAGEEGRQSEGAMRAGTLP